MGDPPARGSGVVLSKLDLSSNQASPGSGILPVQGNLEQQIATYDPVNGNIYIRGNGADDISVVNASTFTDLANIPAPVDNQLTFYVPPIAVDNQTGYLYSTNAGVSSNVSILSPTTDLATGSIPVGGTPHGIAFDWRNHDFYVADFSTANVTVFSGATNKTVTSIHVGTDPLAVEYDSASNRVFVTNYGSANVSVIDPATNTVATTVAVKTDPIAITTDTVDDLVDVLNSPTSGSSSVSVFSATSSTPSVTNVSVASYAESFAFDPVQDQLFVAGGSGGLTVIQQPGNGVVPTAVAIGSGATDAATAYDPRNGDVIVSAYDGGPNGAGNITVISASSDESVANDTTNDAPYAVVVDPGTGDAYVINGGTSSLEPNVTVLSEATGHPIASVPIWVAPTGVAYDSAQGSLYTVDSAGNDVYEVNAASDHVVGVDIGGPAPTSTSIMTPVVYDGADGDIYTADGAQTVVDVYSPSHALLGAIPVGLYPDALAYDNVSDLLFVAQNYNGNVSIIDTATNTVSPTSLLVADNADLDAIAYDPHSNEVYVADSVGHNVTVWGAVNDTKVKTIEVGSDPTSIVVDPQNNTVFVANYDSGNVSVISDATNTVVASVPLAGSYLLAYDSGNGAIYNDEAFEDVVDAFNATTYAPLAGSPLLLEVGGGFYVEGIAYDPLTGDLYISDSTGDALITVGPVPTYPVEFYETGLRQGTAWSVTLNGTQETSISPVIEFVEVAGHYVFNIDPVPGYTSVPTWGAIVVPDPHQPINVTFTSQLTTGSPVEELYSLYSVRTDLQSSFPDAFANFTNYTELVHWAAWVLAAGSTADSAYSALEPYGYYYILMNIYDGRPDLKASLPDAFGNFTNYTKLIFWAGGAVVGDWVDNNAVTLQPYGYYYVLMSIYSGRPDLEVSFPSAYTDFVSYESLVLWAGGVVNGTFVDNNNATLAPYGYWYVLVGWVYGQRSDLQASFPSALTNETSYLNLLAWAKEVVLKDFPDPAYIALHPFASTYEELG